jgi:hypothetical protein
MRDHNGDNQPALIVQEDQHASFGATTMIPSQFRFEANFAPEDYQKIGLLALRWSHIDHVIANCLKVLLRLTDEEAVIIVFPLSTDHRLNRIRKMIQLTPSLTEEAKKAFSELDAVMKGIQQVRNNVIHAVIMGGKMDPIFEMRSKQRSFTKTDIFETEELTNYAGMRPWCSDMSLVKKTPRAHLLHCPADRAYQHFFSHSSQHRS